MTVNWRDAAIGAVIAALVAAIVCGLFCRKSGLPPAVAVRVDTLMQIVGGETSQVLVYTTDPKASKALQRLRDELQSKQTFIDRLTMYLDEMQSESRYLADSLSRIVLDTMHGMLQVKRGPNGIAAVTYRNGVVETWRLPVWRQRWMLTASADKPVVKQSRLPVDLGLFAVGGFDTPPSDWQPEFYGWAGLAITREKLTAAVGPYFDGKLKLRGELRADWRL